MKFTKSSLLVKIVILVLVVYATVTLVRLRSQISEKNTEATELTSSIVSTQQENDRLQEEIDALSTDEGLFEGYIELLVSDKKILENMVGGLKDIDGIQDVVRTDI